MTDDQTVEVAEIILRVLGENPESFTVAQSRPLFLEVEAIGGSAIAHAVVAIASTVRQQHGELVNKQAMIDFLRKAAPTQVIQNQTNMRDNYNNSGQVGAQGPNAKVYDNTFIQQISQAVEQTPISPEDLQKLDQVISHLLNGVEKLQRTEALQAAAQLSGVKDALEKGDTESKTQAVAGWRQWLNEKGDTAKEVIGTVANLVTVAAPILQLLGLPA